MSETPIEHQTPIERHLEEHGFAEAGAREPRGQSLKAGGQFLKALVADLGSVASRLKPKPRQSQPPIRVASRSGIGRVLWRASMVFLGCLLICSGMLSAAMLWVIFGSPLESRHGAPAAPQLQAEATAPIQPGPTPAAAAEPQNLPEETKTEASIQPSPPPAGAVQQKPPEETQATAGTNQPQPSQPPATQTPTPAAGQQQVSATAPDQRPGPQCAADLCAAKHRSFNAADCTYQPNGAGPRSLCALDAQTAVAGPQSLPVVTNPSPKVTETQPVAMGQSDRGGAQCNRSLCAATYRSFNAADCTYQPNGGGPRSICELNKGPAEAAQQTLRPATDSEDSTPAETGDMPVPVMVHEIAEPAPLDQGGPQCNRSRCAATYHSFHAADCTYQPPGGGPRRVCEP